ncbi:MAG: FAD-binding oxidoreductase [Solirubrobacteraceae bacterium]|nr:FAD-binding oxidoreductase [Solirubrobacteraceae bacterium]
MSGVGDPTLADALRAAVGDRHVLLDADLRAPYEIDWTRRFGAPARAVVRPGSTAEVAAVLRACGAHRVAVVPQGGNTGLVGGGVPRGGEVVVSLTRMRDVGEVGALGQVEVAAGATLTALQARAAAAGLDAGLDFAARDSATIGGIVACDAGGTRALRHGTARARVVGLEAVLADGSIVRRMGGLAKDNAGLNLPALLIGSEGTLAVVTRVVWKLVPRLPARVAALVPLPDAASAVSLFAALIAEAPSLEACELMGDAGMELVLAHLRRERPVPRAPVYVLAELAARRDPTDELAAAFARAGIEDAAIADDTTSRERLWTLREGHTEAISARGVPHKLDVGVPLAALPGFLERLPDVVAGACPGAHTIVFGHLGDGNLHVNVLGPEPADEAADDAVLELVLACGGAISAEHGLGVAKARWLTAARGADEVAAMRRIKAALDAGGMLNPGVILG